MAVPTTTTTAPYGTWTSPITADLIAKKSNSVVDILVDARTSELYHVEKRPEEAGRNAIVNSKARRDVFGLSWNARTGVHEYGGTSTVVHDGVVYFSHFTDGRVYRVREGQDPVAVTPRSDVYRYAELTPHPTHPHLFLSILEDHTHSAPADILNSLITINTNTSTIHPFASGADFYSSGTFNPSGTRVAWIQWYHPDMPWEAGELIVAEVDIESGVLGYKNPRKVAGERLNISVSQPQWANDDTLLFTSDETGWHNPYIVHLSQGSEAKVSPLLKAPLQEDFASPAWSLGVTYFSILDNNKAIFTALKDGKSVLYKINLITKDVTELANPFVYVSHVRRVSGSKVAFLGERTDQSLALVIGTIEDESSTTTLGFDFEVLLDDKSSANLRPYFSSPHSISVTDGDGKDEPVHVVFYPPHNPGYVPPAGEKPPCVVFVHGGPTGLTTQGLNLRKQFFTSRGWAWLDVNYGGSSGYGRKYVGRLVGKWGIVDVADCVTAVNALTSATSPSPIDPSRVVITGGSAGGFTVLAALCASPNTFAAGTSSYGVSDLRKLAEDTHKFESRYLEKLVGGTVEEVPELYKERSPVYNAGNIRSPLLILQGSIDKVVPPAQAEEMMKVIKANGGRVEYVLFEGEGHGWRKAENIVIALEKELAFYNDVFKL